MWEHSHMKKESRHVSKPTKIFTEMICSSESFCGTDKTAHIFLLFLVGLWAFF